MPEKLIRSVFEQYSHLENRLTNALIQVLASDEGLTREFVRLANVPEPPRNAQLSFSCQLIPGERRKLDDEESPEVRAVPDAWIYCGTWALLIEAKVEAHLEPNQLRRHVQIAKRRDFDEVQTVAITADEQVPDRLLRLSNTRWLNWPSVYRFLADRRSVSDCVARFLCDQFLEYVRAVEAKGLAGDRILSTFTGVPFGPDRPYNEREARVVVRSLLRELRPRLAQSHVLPPFWSDFPKKPLTGTWDVIPFEFSRGHAFTRHPHLSVGIWEDGSSIELIVPNNAGSHYWKQLGNRSGEDLRGCLLQVLQRVRPFGRQVESGQTEPRIMFEILHRHFPTRTRSIVDGILRFDIESLSTDGARSVKKFPGWINAAKGTLSQARNVNLQAELKAVYPPSVNSISRTPDFVNELVRAAEAMQPFLDLLRGESS